MRLISKVIVGAAVASACGYASAATITKDNGTATGYSREAASVITANTSNTNLGTVNILLASGYVLNDTIEITASGASFGSADAGHSASFTCANGAGVSTVFRLVSGTTSSLITYTSDTPVGVTAGQSCLVNSLFFRSNTLTTVGNVQLSSVSKKAANQNSFDTASAATVASVANEFSISQGTGTKSLDGVIDVQASRITFASGSDGAGNAGSLTSVDEFSFSLNRAGLTAPTGGAYVTGTMVLTLTAGTSFGFLQDPDGQTGAGSCSVTLGSGQAAATALGIAGLGTTIALSPTSGSCNVMTVTMNTVGAGTYAVDLGRSGNATTTVSTPYTQQGYTASVALTSGTVSLASGSPTGGSWSINGTTVNIPYVPISSTANLQVFVANRSNQSGAVNFTAWNASGTSCTGTLGSIDAQANASYGSALRTALQECTGTGWTGAARATVQITTPTPSTQTAVHSAFSVSDTVSRGIVVNDTNGK